ncbi:MAG: hypothetical protein DM484_20620 [Candidatus Methylumidiphilus alinenensis]|uniref:Carboxypeptidase regulatory-like domain-containing protein n=1 Tax=Candidatus Methylumidiphilus alinenensis TaxID=2202197 RepID=A0A2W4SPE3_9GAMM|nr:MAG: hypothetical protein DM484_20620 [Candidatus Methylumidiphilus alinenensis]
MNKFFLSIILFLMAASNAAMGAYVSGEVVDQNGQPISQSTLCLSAQSTVVTAAPNCLQTQTTDANGNYVFGQVSPGAYMVTIIDGRFPTFTWLPVARNVTVAQFSDTVTGFNFNRQFSYSNFQKPVTLSGVNLPELAGFNLSQDTVFVKVYAVNPANPTQQTVFFIGRVTNEANLKFAASAPWTVNQVIYEIFSSSASAQGSLYIQS